MSIMGKKVWAVCCGALRNEFELYLILAKLCDYRREKLLDGIVLSTWKGETESIDGLSEKLKELGILLVETEALNEDVNAYVDLSFARQACQLRRGMEIVPDNVFVLKCRTDYSMKRMVDIRSALDGKIDFKIGNHGSMYFGLNYRIGVYRLNSNLMFHLHDQVFIGYKSDMMQMTRLPLFRYGNQRFLSPEIAFFYNLFIDKYQVLDEWVSLFDVFKTIGGFYAYAENAGIDFELPGMLNRIWAMYFILLKNCFCFFDSCRKEEPTEPFYIADAFTNKQEWKKSSNERFTRFMNTQAIDMIVDGKCIPTRGYLKLLSEILKFAQAGYAENCSITKEEYEETWLWLEEVLKVKPGSYMRRFIKKEAPVIRSIEFNEVMALFTGDQVWVDNKELGFAVEHYVQRAAEDTYMELAENFELFDKNLHAMEADVMGSAGRTLQPWLLKEIAKRAYAEEDIKNGIKKGFIFERWKGSFHLYPFPMKPQQIAAVYLYSSFREHKCGVSENAKMFYVNLARHYKRPLQANIVWYTDAITDLIRDIINEQYGEFRDNIDILNLVDFWIDERNINELSKGAEEFLKGYAAYRKVSLPFGEGRTDAVEKMIALAGNVEAKEEAEAILPWLLCERESVSCEHKEQIDEIIAVWGSREYIRPNIIMQVSAQAPDGGNVQMDSEMIKREVDSLDHEQFMVLCQILGRRKMLGQWEEIILSRCKTENERLLVKVLKHLEKNDRLCFLCEKKGDEYWVNLSDTEYHDFEKQHFSLPRNEEGILWPYASKCSSSPFAAFMKMTKKGLRVRIEFTAVTSLAKHYLAEAVAEENILIDEERVINRLKQTVYPVMDSASSLEEAVCNACREIERTGELIERGYAAVLRKMSQM